mmetsp:Transcript_48592/g.143573  ORF Transcript_48592/g.143573 Transcript_48592/m.143573 type:complete len:120 (+) Transcript_48592:1-360(+)
MESALAAAESLRQQAERLAPLKESLSKSERALAEVRAARDEMEKRVHSNDSQLDLLRNAIARRDWLLAEQRTGYFKDLMRYKGFEAASQPPPAPDWEASLARKAGIQQHPVFFDAYRRP